MSTLVFIARILSDDFWCLLEVESWSVVISASAKLHTSLMALHSWSGNRMLPSLPIFRNRTRIFKKPVCRYPPYVSVSWALIGSFLPVQLNVQRGNRFFGWANPLPGVTGVAGASGVPAAVGVPVSKLIDWPLGLEYSFLLWILINYCLPGLAEGSLEILGDSLCFFAWGARPGLPAFNVIDQNELKIVGEDGNNE